MTIANLFLPVICLGIVSAVVLLGTRRKETGEGGVPPGLQPPGAVTRPLPVDRRAHLTWLVEVSPDEEVRRESAELLDEDNKFRGRGPKARSR